MRDRDDPKNTHFITFKIGHSSRWKNSRNFPLAKAIQSSQHPDLWLEALCLSHKLRIFCTSFVTRQRPGTINPENSFLNKFPATYRRGNLVQTYANET